ncbi:MAG: hypothetical protein ABI629_02515 [bacterium]
MLKKLVETMWPRHRAAKLLLFIGLSLFVLAPRTASATQPATALAAQTATGCCACRGTKGGEKMSLKACFDGLTGAACLTKCSTPQYNAGSFVFGYQQTCAQGCSGLPTQGLK